MGKGKIKERFKCEERCWFVIEWVVRRDREMCKSVGQVCVCETGVRVCVFAYVRVRVKKG